MGFLAVPPSRTIIGIGIVCVLVSMAGMFLLYRDTIMELIQHAAIRMRTTPWSSLIMIAILTVASIPPVLGFTFATTLTGFIYGFPQGVPPAVIGAFLGAMTCFALVRVGNVTRWISMPQSKQGTFNAVRDAVEQGGIRIMVLIRLSPIPWPITNLMLSLLPGLSPQTYALTALGASFKLCLEVWIGSQLADLTNPDMPPSAHRVAILTMVASVSLLAIVAFWLYRLTMQQIERATKDKTKGLLGRRLDEKTPPTRHESLSSPKKQM